MIWLYFCKTAEKERTLLGLLREKTGIEPHICRNQMIIFAVFNRIGAREKFYFARAPQKYHIILSCP